MPALQSSSGNIEFSVSAALRKTADVILLNRAMQSILIIYLLLSFFGLLSWETSSSITLLQFILWGLATLFLYAVLIKLAFDILTAPAEYRISDAFLLGAKRFIHFAAANIMLFLIIILGLVLFIIPGIYLIFRFIFVSHFLLLNNSGIIMSFKKSRQLTNGRWGSLFVLFLIWAAAFGFVLLISAYTINSIGILLAVLAFAYFSAFFVILYTYAFSILTQ